MTIQKLTTESRLRSTISQRIRTFIYIPGTSSKGCASALAGPDCITFALARRDLQPGKYYVLKGWRCSGVHDRLPGDLDGADSAKDDGIGCSWGHVGPHRLSPHGLKVDKL
jgi:hypothetical protein